MAKKHITQSTKNSSKINRKIQSFKKAQSNQPEQLLDVETFISYRQEQTTEIRLKEYSDIEFVAKESLFDQLLQV